MRDQKKGSLTKTKKNLVCVHEVIYPSVSSSTIENPVRKRAPSCEASGCRGRFSGSQSGEELERQIMGLSWAGAPLLFAVCLLELAVDEEDGRDVQPPLWDPGCYHGCTVAKAMCWSSSRSEKRQRSTRRERQTRCTT